MRGNIIQDKLSKFYFCSVCIELVTLRVNLYQEVALSLNKVGDETRLVTPGVHCLPSLFLMICGLVQS